MQKWEYMNWPVNLNDKSDLEFVEINEFGREGWEVIAVHPDPTLGSPVFMAWLKRPIVDSPRLRDDDA